jgi:hypothetical protein
MDNKKRLRKVMAQYTSCELRQCVRHGQGLGLLPHERVKAWRMMAYGVLADRRRIHHDGRAARPAFV